MKLTIGMIVKNEEKWLDKCLSAIQPILDNVDSELIITDTGSTDKTVEIARKYTDKVLFFDWINDFSAARNFGLEKAQGEWFMMLDADDIFRSCDNIIRFFNSGEYKKYNAASYISRNLLKTENGDTYGDILAPRMVKLHPNTRYENAIHESLNTFDPPYKNIQDIADHYGYYYETEDQRYNKFRRNIELLLKRFGTEKDTTPILYVQLYEAFFSIEEKEKAIEFLNNGIELSKRLNSIVLATLYFYKVCHFRDEHKYSEAVSVCDEYFRMSKIIRPYPLTTDGEIYALKAECLYSLERYSEAADIFGNFFNIYKDIESGKISTYDSYLISRYLCSAVNIMPLFNDYLDCCIKAGKFNTADGALVSYPTGRYAYEQKKIYELVQHELVVSEHFSYKNTAKYFEKLDAAGRKVLIDELFDKLSDEKKRKQIFNAINEIAKYDERIARKASIYNSYICQRDAFTEIRDYIGIYGVSSDIDLIYIVIKNGYDLSPVFFSSDFDAKQCAYLCCRNIAGFYKAAENYPVDSIKDPHKLPDAVKFYDYCIGTRLIGKEDKSVEEKELIVRDLITVKIRLNERYKREVTIPNSITSEFELLAASVKKNIRAFIAKGDMTDARKALNDYRKINPKDPDINTLIQQINE